MNLFEDLSPVFTRNRDVAEIQTPFISDKNVNKQSPSTKKSTILDLEYDPIDDLKKIKANIPLYEIWKIPII